MFDGIHMNIKRLSAQQKVSAIVTIVLLFILLVAKNAIPVFFFAVGIVGVVISACSIYANANADSNTSCNRPHASSATPDKPAQHFNFHSQGNFILPVTPKHDDTPEHKWAWATSPCSLSLLLSINGVVSSPVAYFTDERNDEYIAIIGLGADMYFKFHKSMQTRMVELLPEVHKRSKLSELDKKITEYLWNLFCEVLPLIQRDDEFHNLITREKCEGTGPIKLFIGILKLAASYTDEKCHNPVLNKLG
jgi:hypothetical protein